MVLEALGPRPLQHKVLYDVRHTHTHTHTHNGVVSHTKFHTKSYSALEWGWTPLRTRPRIRPAENFESFTT